MEITETNLEPFRSHHLDDALRLSRQAGWPHRREDWELALTLSKGLIVTDNLGKIVGTILVTSYERDCATINMVIVDEKMRGRGLGRRLMDGALELAGNRPLRLIATPDGLPLYEKLGFRETGAILQHQGVAGDVPAPGTTETATTGDIPAIATLDRAAFGAGRQNLIARLADAGQFAVIHRNGGIAGFAAIRAFGRGDVIGPVVAPSLEDAKTLIAHFVSRRRGKFLRIDTGAETGLAAWLTDQGLVHVGGGIAMARPPIFHPATSTATTFALANQALG
ncbi:GNAT family N-acetyltransferase [Neorhizobium alkalisoli]|uniref:GNAT family N-acetyltransferase n=1 Tax=Neorhizobium alkalisoli TaxID=528178 RepID=UPI000CFA4489|nr:GNAT family N-acetyltransferase [Neorhizobium alkalisoli]